ncbi:hypothetical protein AAG906_011885 [Vitis piasezkii]
MAAQNPVEIGTRGTVGSLIMQEIEYFSRLEIGRKDCSQKPQCPEKEEERQQAPTKHVFDSGSCRQQSAKWDFWVHLQESEG